MAMLLLLLATPMLLACARAQMAKHSNRGGMVGGRLGVAKEAERRGPSAAHVIVKTGSVFFKFRCTAACLVFELREGGALQRTMYSLTNDCVDGLCRSSHGTPAVNV